MTFALGQRWLSDTETELGLGTIVEASPRMVSVVFPATGESRSYASQSAPLTRIIFEEGETVNSHEGWSLKVQSIEEVQQQLIYHGVRSDNQEIVSLKETFIDHKFTLNKPQQRLLNGHFEPPRLFDLRHQCLQFNYDHKTSPLLGFTGARADLIPHQLHIASEVGKRFAPRVLLADEVGLGKTVEAALIIHQQLLSGRAKRVLIVVPSSLVHQWLVEMLRRVNLAFSIFDQQRCESLHEENGNPFESEQLVLCSLDFLTHNSQYFHQASEAEWDLMVVDEAHHLAWSPGQPSQEYSVVETLAQKTRGVLLLTATPDQLGHESHFARLRLLDPARFHDYQSFVNEEKQYISLASAISPLMSEQPLEQKQIDQLAGFLGDPTLVENINQRDGEYRQKLISQLLDRHGTGRLLFRNSRASVSGFPDRHLFTYPLELPEAYQALVHSADTDHRFRLAPEQHSQIDSDWVEDDPRVEWFIQQLQSLKGEKVLTICAKAETAIQLSEALRVQAGIRATVFHEGLSIVERDQAANYFSQSEEGAQVLICSEIGSEGRNFQFAHHLVLFDLPLVPDLLEQRIGRLDRIGQNSDVHIHVPYFEDTAQELLVLWYHQGLDAFEHTCPTGTTVYAEVQESLLSALNGEMNEGQQQELIEQTRALHLELKQRLESGRDKLLELNSSGQGKIEPLIEGILDAEDSPVLEKFMGHLFNGLGINQEDHDEVSYFLKPTESMVNNFPGLEEDGMTITYEREAALQLEHIHFFSWDHPMVQHAMDMILTDITGKSSIALQQNKQLPPGSYWLECLYLVSGKAPADLQLDRFLPPTPIRLCFNANGQPCNLEFANLMSVKRKMGEQLAKALAPQLENVFVQADAHVTSQAENLKQQKLNLMKGALGEELNRLQELQKVNPSVREEEIQHLQQQIASLSEVISAATVDLEAVRLVVNNH